MALGGTRERGAVATKQIAASCSSYEHKINYSCLKWCSNQGKYWNPKDASPSVLLFLLQDFTLRNEELSSKPHSLPVKMNWNEVENGYVPGMSNSTATLCLYFLMWWLLVLQKALRSQVTKNWVSKHWLFNALLKERGKRFLKNKGMVLRKYGNMAWKKCHHFSF